MLALDEIGLRNEAKQASDQRDLLRSHQAVIERLRADGQDITDVVLILGVSAVATANTFAAYLPGATIHLLHIYDLDPDGFLEGNVQPAKCTTISDRVDYLNRIPRPQMIIENGNNHRRQKLACLRQLFLFLEAGGTYAVEETMSVGNPKLDDGGGDDVLALIRRIQSALLGLGTSDDPVEAELVECTATLQQARNVAYLTKRHTHAVKLRDHAANVILGRRFEDRWGRVLATKPAHSYANPSQLISHGEGPVKHRTEIKVPERSVRVYQGAVCQTRQRITLGGYYLPDTFRHPQQRQLNNRALINSSPTLARSADETTGRWQLVGNFFYFDTEYPGHFGHVTTEVLGRYWGWTEAVKLAPDLRPLISLDPDSDSVPGFQREIFDALDIPTDRIEYIHPGDAVEVDQLYAVTPGFAMPHYADQELADAWEQVGDRLDTGMSTPKLIFASRRPRKIRSCRNNAEVEDFFAGLGFTVIYPEDYPFAEQVTMFRHADLIAGFGGSNTFCTMFAGRTPRIIVTGAGYTANNEQLIAAATGGDIHYVWGDSEINQPRGGWTWAAFQSNFTVDLDRVGSEIAKITEDVCTPAR
jgi:capsular polysaccharide biosynthesis protein